MLDRTSRPLPSYSLTCTPRAEDINQLIEDLLPLIKHTAFSLASRVYTCFIDARDLEQEALITILETPGKFDASKATHEQSLHSYAMIRARGAMLNYVKRQLKGDVTSLEDYLEIDTASGSIQRDIAEVPVQKRFTPYRERRRILAAMRKLTTRQRLAVMSFYRIEDARGNVSEPSNVKQRLHLSNENYISAKAAATKKLQTLL